MAARLLLALAILAITALPARTEQLVAAVSSSVVRITSNFTGTEITVFGAIERDAATISRQGPYDIAVVLKGPSTAFVTRKKERVLGLWVNAQSRTYVGVPSFYALATTRSLQEMAVPQLWDKFQLGLSHINLPEYIAGDAPVSAQRQDFRAAFIELKSRAGLYREDFGTVEFMSPAMFRANMALPANVPVGDYVAEVYLFRDQAVLARMEARFAVRKVDFEQMVFDFSRHQGWLYGIAAVALALLTGWLAGIIFRKD